MDRYVVYYKILPGMKEPTHESVFKSKRKACLDAKKTKESGWTVIKVTREEHIDWESEINEMDQDHPNVFPVGIWQNDKMVDFKGGIISIYLKTIAEQTHYILVGENGTEFEYSTKDYHIRSIM